MNKLAEALDRAKVVSWDIDGTLYSMKRMRRQLVLSTIHRAVATPSMTPFSELRRLRRISRQLESIRWQSARLSDLAESDRKELLALHRRNVIPAVKASGRRPGIGRLLHALSQRGVPLLSLSDFDPVERLKALDLAEVFDAGYCGVDVGFLKPHPQLFRVALKEWNVRPRQLLHVGDRPETDGAASAAAGCECLIWGRDFTSAHQLLAAWGLRAD